MRPRLEPSTASSSSVRTWNSAAEVAVEIDHAAGVAGRRLESFGKGLILGHPAVASIRAQLQADTGTSTALDLFYTWAFD
ncbi:MAG: hypothetical protein ABIO19_04925 [Burkholderiaceae bacterium]